MSRDAGTGLERMRALAGELPNDLLEGFRAGRELNVTLPVGRGPVTAVGMGASAIAADLTRGLVDAEGSSSLTVVRGPDLPGAVRRGSSVLVLSYSGETTEALEAYDLAGRRGADRIVVTSGGRLAEKADNDGVPVLRVPTGRPPRAAVGHLWGGTLGLLDPLFAESIEHRLEVVCGQLRDAIPRLASGHGPVGETARGLIDRLPFVVAERSFLPLARRWTSQIEENAKRLAVPDELPEALHNSLVGWDALRRGEAVRFSLVLLEWTGETPLVRRAMRHLAQVARARKVRTFGVPLPYEDRLGAVAYGIALGDLVSLDLARRRHVDPYPIVAIARGRAAIASEGAAVD